jgi:hypothetical protein
LVCIIGSFILSWVITGNLVKAIQAIFNAVTVAFNELLGGGRHHLLDCGHGQDVVGDRFGRDDVSASTGNHEISGDRLLGHGLRHL